MLDSKRGQTGMKKICIISIMLLGFTVSSFAVQPTVDTQKNATINSIQVLQKASLGKKTQILPKGTTNWSKIKDLFR